MACNCRRGSNNSYVWTSTDGSKTIVYASEIQAKAKVNRAGGSYAKKEG